MARTTKKKNAKKKGGSTLNPGAVGVIARGALGEGLDMAWRIGTLVFVVALAVAWVSGRGPLREAAAGGYDIVRVVVASPASKDASSMGVPEVIVPEVLRLAELRLEQDPFDHAGLAAAREALAASGWFSSIGQVKRTPGNEVVIEASWRQPRAMVETRGGGAQLVGEDGAPMDVRGMSVGGLVTITNPLEPAPRTEEGTIASGEPWGLSDVQDAIALLDLFAERGLERQYVDSIDVRNPSRMVVTTTSGARIVWGGPIDEVRPGEAPVRDRLEMLATAFQDPRLNRPGRELDARTGQVTIDSRPGT